MENNIVVVTNASYFSSLPILVNKVHRSKGSLVYKFELYLTILLELTLNDRS